VPDIPASGRELPQPACAGLSQKLLYHSYLSLKIAKGHFT